MGHTLEVMESSGMIAITYVCEILWNDRSKEAKGQYPHVHFNDAGKQNESVILWTDCSVKVLKNCWKHVLWMVLFKFPDFTNERYRHLLILGSWLHNKDVIMSFPIGCSLFSSFYCVKFLVNSFLHLNEDILPIYIYMYIYAFIYIPILKERWSRGRVIFILRIPIHWESFFAGCQGVSRCGGIHVALP